MSYNSNRTSQQLSERCSQHSIIMKTFNVVVINNNTRVVLFKGVEYIKAKSLKALTLCLRENVKVRVVPNN